MNENNKTKINKYGLPNIVLPAEILYNDKIPWRTKSLFGFIHNLAKNKKGYCWATNHYLSEHIQVKQQKTVSEMISLLQKEGYLILEYETSPNGTQNRKIFVDNRYSQKYDSLLKGHSVRIKTKDPSVKKVRGGYLFREGGFPKKVSNIDNINNKENIDNNILLRNIVDAKKAPTKIENNILEILSFWNKLPHTTKHKIDPKSKTFKSISSRLKNMLLGLPIENKNKDGSLNKVFQKFLHENNIPEEIYLKKWDTNKITNIFQIINDANSNKNKLSMDTALWNYFAGGRATGYSHFLYTANNLDISEKNDEHKELTVLFMDAIGKKDIEFSKQIQCDHAFYAMIESGIDILELRNVILWYKAHKNDKYSPKAHDVQEFRDKYDRILEAKNRDEEPSSQTNIRRRRQAPVKTKNAEHTKESLHLFEHEDLNENLKLYNSLVDYCVNKRDIWGGEIKPDKDIIFEAIMALKQFMNNLTEYDPYHWNSIDIIFRNYIDYIDEESWINRLSTHSPLFPDFSTFEDFTKWYHGNGVRSRGWGEDIDLPMLSASEILIKRNDDKEAKENDKQEKESSAQRINDLTIFMHNSMRERLTKISDTQIEKIELDCWTKQDDNKELREEFIKFVDEVEKEHLSNPIQRNKSYPHLFRLKNTES